MPTVAVPCEPRPRRSCSPISASPNPTAGRIRPTTIRSRKEAALLNRPLGIEPHWTCNEVCHSADSRVESNLTQLQFKAFNAIDSNQNAMALDMPGESRPYIRATALDYPEPPPAPAQCAPASATGPLK